MVKVFGIFPSGQFTPEIIAASSERDAVKRAISNGSLQRHEVRDADIRELSADEILFWCDRPITDHELMLNALKHNDTPAGDIMRNHLIVLGDELASPEAIALVFNADEEPIALFTQLKCWEALWQSLKDYKPSVQRDRILKDVEFESQLAMSEYRSQLQTDAEERMEGFGYVYAA